jgi:hypothetical protein
MDIGVVKDRYPGIDGIDITATSITITTSDSVVWIANGVRLPFLHTLPFYGLPHGTVVVRAEVINPEGSTGFAQPFSIRPVGDLDGDGRVDVGEQAICLGVAEGQDADPDHRAGCR